MKINHVLISRTDNIGDVVCTLPLAGIIKSRYPNCKITLLARDYVRAIATHSKYIDDFLSWDILSKQTEADAIAFIQSKKIDVVMHVHHDKIISQLMKKAKIPYRIASVSRSYHWSPTLSRSYQWRLCNKLTWFDAKKTGFHEMQRHLGLLKPLKIKAKNDLDYLHSMMGFGCDQSLPDHLRSVLHTEKFNLIMHPFSHGHGREWPPSRFVELIQALPKDRFHIILTGSEKEKQRIQNEIIVHCENAVSVAGCCNLDELITLISKSDGLLANGTGPMHLAGALNKRTLGIFPFKRTIGAECWKPLGNNAETVIADPNCQEITCVDKKDCYCMKSITVNQVKEIIMRWL